MMKAEIKTQISELEQISMFTLHPKQEETNNPLVGGHVRKWNLEKLVYRRVLKRGARYDRKFVVQAQHAAATGVHMSMNMKTGKNVYPRGNKIRHYHYHDTIQQAARALQHVRPDGE